jgi:hypothetical protein
MTNGPFTGEGNAILYADMVKEHYLVTPIQALMWSSPLVDLRYEHGGTLYTFEEILFETGDTEAFRDPRIRAEFEAGLVLHVNHGETTWSVQAGGVTYLVPEDGWVAHDPVTGLLAFSAMPSNDGVARIDYANVPDRWEVLDGRGAVDAFGGLSTPSRRLIVRNDVRGLVLREDANGELEVLSESPPPLVSVSIEPGPVGLLPGEERPVRALARYANGAVRDVTKLVSWTTSDPTVAIVDSGGSLHACAAGSCTVTVELFEGVNSRSTLVTVQASP